MDEQNYCIWLPETWVLTYCDELRIAISETKPSGLLVTKPGSECYVYDRSHPDWKQKRISGVGACDKIIYWYLFLKYHSFMYPGNWTAQELLSNSGQWQDGRMGFECLETLFKWRTLGQRFGESHKPAPHAGFIAKFLCLEDKRDQREFWCWPKTWAVEEELPWSSTFYFVQLQVFENPYPDSSCTILAEILARNDAEAEARTNANPAAHTQKQCSQ
jgi:hypothetical protein